MAIKLEMLRTFRIVAEQGSLTAAAGLLARTPSAVSMTLAQLEAHIGAPLFETDRKNRLTPLGQRVLEESSRATDAFTRSVEAIGRHAISTAGTVRIAAVPSAAITVLPGVIAAFRRIRPDVRLEISDVDSAAVRRRVKLDAADIGILSASSDDPADGNVILEDDLGIVCRKDGAISRAAADSAALSWALLEREPIIANPLCHLVAHDCVPRLLAACNLEARNTTALLSFVRAGLGATVLPRGAVQHQPDELAFLMPTDPTTRRQLRKVRSEDRHLGPAAEAFWEAL
ncbi:DNA-binding transcriptional regulator, LysR family [Roseivivax lentus]|uniref:DNA-binding transcriptional regulator, LysR family n=1 Tax=Roseivivax lentus TaxID=633194 RepID=A0A1N7MUC8_9RHOB|nr:LysR family transcriptional regulator [Roseivivax lentus]SIS89459.1 DNA-binding transcriptional regulator, LysR family [Roseivivax lentus]